MDRVFNISEVRFQKNLMQIVINGKVYSFCLHDISEKLGNAKEEYLYNYIISPSGYGIHWPLIDEDIAINGLLKLHQKHLVK